MIHRTIAVALLAGLAAPALANTPPTGPAYDQAAGLAAGHSADAVYDGGAARTPVQVQVDGALTQGGLAVEHPVPPAVIKADVPPDLPPPPSPPSDSGLFNKTSLMYGAGGAAVGGGIGWLFGGLLGAVIGAVAGFAIGFVLSKFMSH